MVDDFTDSVDFATIGDSLVLVVMDDFMVDCGFATGTIALVS